MLSASIGIVTLGGSGSELPNPKVSGAMTRKRAANKGLEFGVNPR